MMREPDLRAVPPGPSSSGPSNGGGEATRLTRLETQMEYVATKADLKHLENTLIKWMLGTIGVTALTLIAATLRSLI